MPYRIYLIESDGPEFSECVVITDDLPEDVIQEHGVIKDALDIDGDASAFFCNRPLVHAT